MQWTSGKITALKHFNKPVKWHLMLLMRNSSGEKKTSKLKTISAMRLSDVQEEMSKEFDRQYELINVLTPSVSLTYSLEIDDEDWELAKTAYEKTDEYKIESAKEMRRERTMNLLNLAFLLLIIIGLHAEFTCQSYSFQLLRECPSRNRKPSPKRPLK